MKPKHLISLWEHQHIKAAGADLQSAPLNFGSMIRLFFTGIKKGNRDKNPDRGHRSGNRPNGLCAVRTDGGRDWDCRGVKRRKYQLKLT